MDLVEQIDRELREAGTPERADHERRYLKSDLVHYGVGVPAIRRIAKSALLHRGPLYSGPLYSGPLYSGPLYSGPFSAAEPVDHEQLVALIERLWAIPVHERRMAAVEIACLRVDRLEPGDIALLERMLRQARTWALIDALSVNAVGPLLDRHPDADIVLDGWIADDDFWIRRSALLSHLKALREGGGNWERFSRYADACLEEKEFFIRKAIGWVLRDTARKRPDMVYDWILPRAHRASGITVREAVKRLDPTQSAAVMARYRADRR